MSALNFRTVEHLITGTPTSDGAGVKLTRVLTPTWQQRLDPFLMLDAFRNENPEDYIGGFPNHPHRGFETVTYMLAGRMRHKDSAGHEGLLGAGGMQWMTAGSGLIHSELPEQEQGLMEGFQLWLNLPAKNKMTTPSYKDVANQAIPEWTSPDGITVRILAGSAQGLAGAVQRPDTEPLLLDVHLPAGMTYIQEMPAAYNAFTYTYRGTIDIQGQAVPDRTMAILTNQGEALKVSASPQSETRFLIVAGKPLGEPIVQYGPFVMNSKEEIYQAMRDYQAGQFEAAAIQVL
ncbi:pirin family protein [Thiolinea disciformis]|uniref:pirin family protein n=1 Tax=Thiolinea disciformis TaxID=125614 RepID=UPI00035CB02D|nr:pirin family protein [Thiolinea disciformis]